MKIKRNTRAPSVKLTVSLVLNLLFISQTIHGYMVDKNPIKRAKFLDSAENFHLQWMVDKEQDKITFNLTVQTKGWILFGLANNVESGRDVVIGGVDDKTGKIYFSDYHQSQGSPGRTVLDRKQDYKLEDGWEKGETTFLSFSRPLDTCDGEDYKITRNRVTLIWGFGEDDIFSDIARSKEQSGSYNVYLLNPEYSPRIMRDVAGNPRLMEEKSSAERNLQTWAIKRKIEMPTEHTSYLCTIHKAPRLKNKHHVVGFEVHFPDLQSAEHIHHLIVYKCNAPKNYNAKNLFEPFVEIPAQTCFFPGKPPEMPGGMPVHFCNQLYTGWALGANSFFLPPQAGLPFGENSDEYYMAQVHYDNPQQKTNVSVTVRMDFWYTPSVRRNDAGLMAIGIDTAALPPSLLVPPYSTEHRVLGHCSSDCTRRIYPFEGITAFAGTLHSHSSGSRMRLRHFDMEKNVELPWILYDDNYNNQFQDPRHFPEVVQILPGDQLTMECTYNSNWTNGSVVGGYSTNQEMCIAFIYYYGAVKDYSQCRSQIVSESARKYFLEGLENVTWTSDKIDWVALTPTQQAGKTLTEIADGVNWDSRLRQELQHYHETASQQGSCSRDLFSRSEESLRQAMEARTRAPNVYPAIYMETEDDFSGLVQYPFEAKSYVPPEETKCSSKG